MNADAGIRLILEELRDLKREAVEDRRRSDDRFERLERKLDKGLTAIAGAMKSLAEATSRLARSSEEHRVLLKDIRDAVRSPRRNGNGGNGKH